MVHSGLEGRTAPHPPEVSALQLPSRRPVIVKAAHAHFHEHDTRPRHAHDHVDGDTQTAHAHSTLLVRPPAIPQGSVTIHPDGDWSVTLGDLDVLGRRDTSGHEKMASPPKPIRRSEK